MGVFKGLESLRQFHGFNWAYLKISGGFGGLLKVSMGLLRDSEGQSKSWFRMMMMYNVNALLFTFSKKLCNVHGKLQYQLIAA